MSAAADKSQATTELLLRALQRRYGSDAKLENVVLPTLGGSNQTVVFDLVEGTTRRRLVSRRETFTSPQSPFLSPSQQFQLLKVAFRHGIPAPEPILEFDEADGLGRGYVTAFVGGETMPKRLLSEARFASARAALAAQSGELLARLHAIPLAEVSFLEDLPDSRDPLGAQLARLDSYGEAHPAIEVGARWLQGHRPKTVRRQLVHGDYRTGNLLVDESGLRALLDWECAHIGSGHEDLGWLCMRSWRFGKVDDPVGGFGARADLYRSYAEVSGGAVDPDEVRWWEIFGMVRWIVLNVMQAYSHEYEGRRSVAYAACGRNASLYEYELLMTLTGRFT
jgi:aminoglycoside phosphotransferase (APT) family kinase protein